MNTNTIENAKEIISSYKREDGKKLRIMEVCGTHTHEIFRLGIRKLLPESVELISGPGCPVCVTPVGFIDEACMLALEKGDMHFRRPYKSSRNRNEPCRSKVKGCCDKDSVFTP